MRSFRGLFGRRGRGHSSATPAADAAREPTADAAASTPLLASDAEAHFAAAERARIERAPAPPTRETAPAMPTSMHPELYNTPSAATLRHASLSSSAASSSGLLRTSSMHGSTARSAADVRDYLDNQLLETSVQEPLRASRSSVVASSAAATRGAAVSLAPGADPAGRSHATNRRGRRAPLGNEDTVEPATFPQNRGAHLGTAEGQRPSYQAPSLRPQSPTKSATGRTSSLATSTATGTSVSTPSSHGGVAAPRTRTPRKGDGMPWLDEDDDTQQVTARKGYGTSPSGTRSMPRIERHAAATASVHSVTRPTHPAAAQGSHAAALGSSITRSRSPISLRPRSSKPSTTTRRDVAGGRGRDTYAPARGDASLRSAVSPIDIDAVSSLDALTLTQPSTTRGAAASSTNPSKRHGRRVSPQLRSSGSRLADAASVLESGATHTAPTASSASTLPTNQLHSSPTSSGETLQVGVNTGTPPVATQDEPDRETRLPAVNPPHQPTGSHRADLTNQQSSRGAGGESSAIPSAPLSMGSASDREQRPTTPLGPRPGSEKLSPIAVGDAVAAYPGQVMKIASMDGASGGPASTASVGAVTSMGKPSPSTDRPSSPLVVGGRVYLPPRVPVSPTLSSLSQPLLPQTSRRRPGMLSATYLGLDTADRNSGESSGHPMNIVRDCVCTAYGEALQEEARGSSGGLRRIVELLRQNERNRFAVENIAIAIGVLADKDPVTSDAFGNYGAIQALLQCIERYHGSTRVMERLMHAMRCLIVRSRRNAKLLEAFNGVSVLARAASSTAFQDEPKIAADSLHTLGTLMVDRRHRSVGKDSQTRAQVGAKGMADAGRGHLRTTSGLVGQEEASERHARTAGGSVELSTPRESSLVAVTVAMDMHGHRVDVQEAGLLALQSLLAKLVEESAHASLVSSTYLELGNSGGGGVGMAGMDGMERTAEGGRVDGAVLRRVLLTAANAYRMHADESMDVCWGVLALMCDIDEARDNQLSVELDMGCFFGCVRRIVSLVEQAEARLRVAAATQGAPLRGTESGAEGDGGRSSRASQDGDGGSTTGPSREEVLRHDKAAVERGAGLISRALNTTSRLGWRRGAGVGRAAVSSEARNDGNRVSGVPPTASQLIGLPSGPEGAKVGSWASPLPPSPRATPHLLGVGSAATAGGQPHAHMAGADSGPRAFPVEGSGAQQDAQLSGAAAVQTCMEALRVFKGRCDVLEPMCGLARGLLEWPDARSQMGAQGFATGVLDAIVEVTRA